MSIKKQYILLCSLLIIIVSLKAQNLVPNPSFETYTVCPQGFSGWYGTYTPDEVKDAPPWSMATYGTADYFNECCTTSVGIPLNDVGGGSYQYARTGSAYMGVITKVGVNNREYICAPLLSALTTGTKYYLSMYVNRPNAGVPSDRIGIYLSTNYPDTSLTTGAGGGYLPVTPQIENPVGNLLSDTINWVQISGWFNALGGENYITIGNFRPDSLTMGVGGFSESYYYIDDVCISTDSSVCIQNGDAGIKQNLTITNSSVYPNPIKQDAILSFSNSENQICTLTLFDNQGVVVNTINNITSNKVKISANNLQSGLYYYILNAKDNILAKGKLVIE